MMVGVCVGGAGITVGGMGVAVEGTARVQATIRIVIAIRNLGE
jgi:hypothetical protein